MYEACSIPPGYVYESTFEDGVLWFGIVDRAGDCVLKIQVDDLGGFGGLLEMVWQIIDASPEVLEHHAAAFLTWQIPRSPLERLAQ